jgi:hypothetical protein
MWPTSEVEEENSLSRIWERSYFAATEKVGNDVACGEKEAAQRTWGAHCV